MPSFSFCYKGFGVSRRKLASAARAASETTHGGLGAGDLVQFHNRYYDPLTGQFTTEDPIGFARGQNLYAYGYNNPVNFHDPFGLCPWCLGAIGGVVTGYAIAKLMGVDYDLGDALVDAALGAAGAGLVSKLDKLNDLRKATRAARGAFEVAETGGKHAGLVQNYAGRSAREIARGVRSLEGRATQHLDKIANPAKYVDEWEKLDPRRQQAIIEGCRDEVALYREQAEVLRGLLNR